MREESTLFVNVTIMYILGFFVGMGVCIASQRWTNAEFLGAVVTALLLGPVSFYMLAKVRV